MTTNNTTTYASEVQAVEIVYRVKDKYRGESRVTVTVGGGYECKCNSFALYGGCRQTDAVKAQRKEQGKKF